MPETKVPPNSLDAETAVLAACLLGEKAVFEAIALLKPEDFYSPKYKRIFECIINLNSKNIAIDMVSLANELRNEKALESIGGLEILSKLTSFLPSAENTHSYIKIIKDNSSLRKLIEKSRENIEEAFEKKLDVKEVIDHAESRIFEISEENERKSYEKIAQVAQELNDEAKRMFEEGITNIGIETGYADLDKKISGLQKQDMIVIAARPSMGKTAFAIGLTIGVARRNPESVIALFSHEMSNKQITQRVLSGLSNVPLKKIQDASYYGKKSDQDKIFAAYTELSNFKLFLDDSSGVTTMDIRGKARRIKKENKGKLDLIVIDYLQLLSLGIRVENRQQETSQISRNVKSLARELDCPVVILSQLSRKNEERHDKKPVLSDLRDSGAIEQDADQVLFLHREGRYNEDAEDPNLTELIIEKNRNGETGVVYLNWRGEFTRFDSRAFEEKDKQNEEIKKMYKKHVEKTSSEKVEKVPF